ncbi:MAG TPA: lytic transglycosylase domain-containing protein [Burkholderiales bacterium]|nr:lytic transglycosylase domain-containing protein [Burkholderiales bacterium]
MRLSTIISSFCLCLLVPCASAQSLEAMSASVRVALSNAIDAPVNLDNDPGFQSRKEKDIWIDSMSARLRHSIPDKFMRRRFLTVLHYEADRAGLDPQLVLGLIQVESGFNQYAISSSSAIGYMQVMPFWIRQIGEKGQDLFNLETNLRYGCTILRHYIDAEHGNLYMALGHYNGTPGRAHYPEQVLAAWKHRWNWSNDLILATYH